MTISSGEYPMPFAAVSGMPRSISHHISVHAADNARHAKVFRFVMRENDDKLCAFSANVRDGMQIAAGDDISPCAMVKVSCKLPLLNTVTNEHPLAQQVNS